MTRVFLPSVFISSIVVCSCVQLTSAWRVDKFQQTVTLDLLQKKSNVSDEVSTRESWLSRLGNSFFVMCGGIFLTIFSVPFMWVNEARNAQQESLIAEGKQECISISDEKAVPSNCGRLIHLSGVNACSVSALEDKRFPGAVPSSGILRLQVEVECYQWHQEVKTKKDKVGGGNHKKYTYEQEWLSYHEDSDAFKHSFYENLPADSIKIGKKSKNSEQVQLGTDFVLGDDLLSQLNEWTQVSVKGCTSSTGKVYEAGPHNWLYYPKFRSNPAIGDMRVRFQVVFDQPVSVLAVQSLADTKHSKHGLTPFRSISQPIFTSLSSEEKCRLRLEAGSLSFDEFYERQRFGCGGVLSILCCCCNLATFCLTSIAPPQVFAAYAGSLNKEDSMKNFASSAALSKWLLRLLAWGLLFAGSMMIFQPLFVVIDIIPFLGPYLSSFVSAAFAIVAFLVTSILAMLIIAAGYLAYHPLTALRYLLQAAAIAAIPIIIKMSLHN